MLGVLARFWHFLARRPAPKLSLPQTCPIHPKPCSSKPPPVPLAAMALVPPLATTGLPRTAAHAAGLPPPTPHANTGRRLSKSIMRADSRQHTRHPHAWCLTEQIPPRHTEKGAARSAGVEATSCSILLAALSPLERHGLSRMQLDWGCETPGRGEVWLEKGTGEGFTHPTCRN